MAKVDPQLGKILQGSYRIERVVGEGGMGTVYEASHLRLARRFAVKLLLPALAEQDEAVTRLRREGEVTSALGHPHILEVVDLNVTEDGQPYIVMEYLEGEDLHQRIQRCGALSLRQAALIACQAASAVQAAHEKGVVHRDLKPQNIFLCRRGARDDWVKVLDFGISKVLHAHSGLTGSNALIGTPAYMAPEQAEERATEVDACTDVYAMGAILYEMLTARPPFLSENIPALLYKIVHKDPAAPGVNDAVDHVVLKALQKKPSERFQSMTEMWEALEAALAQAGASLPDTSSLWPVRGGDPFHAAPNAQLITGPGVGIETTLSAASTEVVLPPTPPVRRRIRMAVLAVASAAVAAVVGIVLLQSSTPTPPEPPDPPLAALQPDVSEVPPPPATPPPADAAVAVAPVPDATASAPKPKVRKVRRKRGGRRVPRKPRPKPEPKPEPKTPPPPLPTTGVIWINARSLPGCGTGQVLVDYKAKGPVPKRLELKVGKHRIEITAPGCWVFRKDVVVQPGGKHKVTGTLKPRRRGGR